MSHCQVLFNVNKEQKQNENKIWSKECKTGIKESKWKWVETHAVWRNDNRWTNYWTGTSNQGTKNNEVAKDVIERRHYNVLE